MQYRLKKKTINAISALLRHAIKTNGFNSKDFEVLNIKTQKFDDAENFWKGLTCRD